jgi:hypothetical protein
VREEWVKVVRVGARENEDIFFSEVRGGGQVGVKSE